MTTMKNDDGPAKWKPDPHPMMPGYTPSEEEYWYNRGVNEGIRWERKNQLRDMAKAALTGYCHCIEEFTPEEAATQAAKTAALTLKALASLAEAEKGNGNDHG